MTYCREPQKNVFFLEPKNNPYTFLNLRHLHDVQSNESNLFSFLFLLFISGQIVTVLCSMLGILYWTRRSLMPWHTLTLLEFLAEQFRAHCWRKLFTWKYKVELFSCIEKASIPSWIKLSKCCSRLVLSNEKKKVKLQITSVRTLWFDRIFYKFGIFWCG